MYASMERGWLEEVGSGDFGGWQAPRPAVAMPVILECQSYGSGTNADSLETQEGQFEFQGRKESMS